jgi:hypothetical protein
MLSPLTETLSGLYELRHASCTFDGGCLVCRHHMRTTPRDHERGLHYKTTLVKKKVTRSSGTHLRLRCNLTYALCSWNFFFNRQPLLAARGM